MPEVQKHGFSWERNLIQEVYGASEAELKSIKYTNKIDLPAALNHLDGVDLSIKTSCSANTVCMGDALRVFDSVSSESKLHMAVVHYKQDDTTKTKKLDSIVEVELTKSREALFGSLTREDIEKLDKLVKSVPAKRKPTPEEHAAFYALQKDLQKKSAAIYLNIKCDSKQSRLQCSFNKFQEFLVKNKERVIAHSKTAEFRGKKILEEVVSGRRQFKKKTAEQSG